ncbi:MAG: hypothetical protein N4A65_11290 [Cohaesibacter sp.]|nr:hypothetical protein [Cohaesibacter sp.]
MNKPLSFTAMASVAGALLLSCAFMSSPAMAADILTKERLDKVEILGKLTGVGLFCSFHDDAVPLKEVIIEVADKHKMDETARAKLGNIYHGSRDKAFNGGREGDYECPNLQQFRADALLAKLNVVQAF